MQVVLSLKTFMKLRSKVGDSQARLYYISSKSEEKIHFIHIIY